MKIQLKRSNVLSSGAAKTPTASQLEYGELAVNYNNSDPAIFLKDSNNNVIRISGVGNVSDDGLTNVPDGTSPPSNPEVGNLWYNSDQGRLYIYFQDADTSQWVDASPDSWDPSSYPDVTNSSAQSNTLDDRYAMVNGGNSFKTASTNSATITTFERSDSAVSSRIHYDGSDGAISLETTTNHPLAFGTNNTERLRIDSSGKVGIGVTPVEALHVKTAGSTIARIESGTNAGVSSIYFADASSASAGWLQYEHSSDALSIGASNNERLRIDSSGTLLIGRTTSSDPNRYVQIHNGSAASSAYFQSTNAGTGSGAADGIVMGMGDATSAYFWNYEAGSLIFATSATERMRIYSDGGVSFKKYLEFRDGGDTTFAGYLGSGNHIISGAANTDFGIRAETNLLFAAGGNAERMRIDSSGNVGIGTTSPVKKFHVSDTSGPAQIRITGASGSSDIYADSNIYFQPNGSTAVTFTSSGNVGIGTTSPNDYTSANYQALTLNGTQGGIIDFESNGTHVGQIFNTASEFTIGSQGSIPLNLRSNGLNRLTVDSAGDVTLQKGLYFANAAGSFITAVTPGVAYRDLTIQGSLIKFGVGSGSATERMRILPTGGITFNGDTAQANALDDYEEGSCTITMFITGTSTVVASSNTTAYYTKIGNVVNVSFYSGPVYPTVAGNAEIDGLPFTNRNASNHYPVATFTHSTAFSVDIQNGYMNTNSNNLYPMQRNSTYQAAWNTSGGAKYVMFTITYQTN